MALPRTLIDPKLIYLEPAVRDYQHGREVLARFPDAKLVEVASHWKIPHLADPALAEDWLRVKREILVLGVKKGLPIRPNGRSADFIAPSSSNGCVVACAYCYVGRRKSYANPISVFVTSTRSPARSRATPPGKAPKARRGSALLLSVSTAPISAVTADLRPPVAQAGS